MTTVNGLDVFHGDGPVDWASVAAAGIEFAYVKASEGVTVTDSLFAQNWRAMKEAGVMRGAYHFFHPASSPEDQAGHLITVMGELSVGDLPPALDLEETSQTHDEWPGIPPEKRIGLVLRWLKKVEDATGMKSVIYTRQGWVRDNLPGAEALKDHPLWVADFKSTDKPRIPAQWAAWTFWQFSETGTMPGVGSGVDLDRFNGASSDLKMLGKGAGLGATTT
jgi:lysozyme